MGNDCAFYLSGIPFHTISRTVPLTEQVLKKWRVVVGGYGLKSEGGWISLCGSVCGHAQGSDCNWSNPHLAHDLSIPGPVTRLCGYLRGPTFLIKWNLQNICGFEGGVENSTSGSYSSPASTASFLQLINNLSCKPSSGVCVCVYVYIYTYILLKTYICFPWRIN